ncbi:MAG: hypothetical protein RCG15_02860 [Candidatus Rickettsia vulgarisii]
MNSSPVTLKFTNENIPIGLLPSNFPKKIGTLELAGSDLNLAGNITGNNLFFQNIKFSNVTKSSKLTFDPSMKLDGINVNSDFISNDPTKAPI